MSTPFKRLPRILLPVLIMFSIAYQIVFGLIPAVRFPGTFATYFTAAHIFVYAPRDMARVYDDEWFPRQINQLGFVDVFDIYNINPPAMPLIAAPLLSLPQHWAQLAWIGLNYLALLGGLHVMGETLLLSRRQKTWLIFLCLLYAPIVTNIARNQVYLFLFLALCLVLRGLVYGKDKLAGLLLGLMLILKTAGIWIFLMLLWHRRWRMLSWVLATILVVGLLCVIWAGDEPWQAYAAALPQVTSKPERFVTAYQTNISLFGHLLVYDAQWNPTPVASMPLLSLILTAGMFLGSMVVTAQHAMSSNGNPDQRALTIALWVSLIVTTTPFAGDHHYCLVLPSLIIAGWWASRTAQSRVSLVLLFAAALMLGMRLPYSNLWFAEGWRALLAYPRVYGAYLLWLWLLFQIHSLHPVPSSHDNPTLPRR